MSRNMISRMFIGVVFSMTALNAWAGFSSLFEPTHPNRQNEQQLQDEAIKNQIAWENEIKARYTTAADLNQEEKNAKLRNEERILEQQNNAKKEIQSLTQLTMQELNEVYEELYNRAWQLDEIYYEESAVLMKIGKIFPASAIYYAFGQHASHANQQNIDQMAKRFGRFRLFDDLYSENKFSRLSAFNKINEIRWLHQDLQDYAKFASSEKSPSALFISVSTRLVQYLIAESMIKDINGDDRADQDGLITNNVTMTEDRVFELGQAAAASGKLEKFLEAAKAQIKTAINHPH